MAKQNKSVVRNAQYRRGGLGVRQRHNERQNVDYMNDDIIKDRADYNVHFKEPTGSYEQMFDSLLAEKTISTRGLGQDPFIVDEMIFDINTSYFEHHGGYEYAKSFYQEAYRCAIEQIGGEQFILSAVMHADERNKEVSERLGYDVYHYHLHVMYVPVVDKEIYFKKNNKDPELAGKLREVIKQVSHSKKWPKHKLFDENGEVKRNEKGKAILLNSYSILQDNFHDHMKAAGFDDFERGERGSTAEHLTVLEFKAKQEKEKAQREADRAAELKKENAKKQKQLEKLDEQITVKEKAKSTIAEIEKMGKLTVLGNFSVSADELTTLKNLSKKSVKADEKVADMRKKLTTAETERDTLKAEKEAAETAAQKAKPSLLGQINWIDKFLAAMKRAPKRLMAVIEDIMRQPPEKEQERTTPERKRSTGIDL